MGDITGVTFPSQTVTPKYDGKLYRQILSDGIIQGCGLTINTPTNYDLTITKGSFVVAGRVMELIASAVLDISGASSGYARIKVDIDTTATSIAGDFQQATFEIEYKADTNFPALTQNDINDTGTNYEFQFCIVSLDGAGIVAVVTNPEDADISTKNSASGVASLDSDTKITPDEISIKDIAVTTSTTLAVAYDNRRLLCSNAGAINITINPQSSTTYLAEHETLIKSAGAGQITIVLGSGVTVTAITPANLNITIGGSVVLKRDSENVWSLDGALE